MQPAGLWANGRVFKKCTCIRAASLLLQAVLYSPPCPVISGTQSTAALSTSVPWGTSRCGGAWDAAREAVAAEKGAGSHSGWGVAGSACRRCRLALPFRYPMGSGGLFRGNCQVLSQPREGERGWMVPRCCHPCGQEALQGAGREHLGRAARGRTHGLMSALPPRGPTSRVTLTPQTRMRQRCSCLATQSEPSGAHPRALHPPYWCRRK